MYTRNKDLRLWPHGLLMAWFSLKAARLPFREQGLNSPERLRVLTDKNVVDICNVMRKPVCKNANKMSNRGNRFQS